MQEPIGRRGVISVAHGTGMQYFAGFRVLHKKELSFRNTRDVMWSVIRKYWENLRSLDT
jgi:hypothetical protein